MRDSQAGYSRSVQKWRAVSVPVGGALAVGFLSESRVVLGSHSGVGVFDANTGERTQRIYDENYGWYQSDPPSIRHASADGVHLVRAAGLWGGNLDQVTEDGWACHRIDAGTLLTADGQPAFRIEEREEYRAQGFSPGGRSFVYVTSPVVYLVTRQS